MAIPYRTAKFKSANIIAIAILGSTASLHQYQASSHFVHKVREIATGNNLARLSTEKESSEQIELYTILY
jgi:hypothetical protein